MVVKRKRQVLFWRIVASVDGTDQRGEFFINKKQACLKTDVTVDFSSFGGRVKGRWGQCAGYFIIGHLFPLPCKYDNNVC